MYLIYVDESGDDGLPGSSKTFINTAIQIKSDNWNKVNKKLLEFRKDYRDTLPLRLEIHTNQIIGRKGNFNELNLTNEEIKNFFREYAKMLSKLDILATTVLINKTILNMNKDVFNECVDRLVNRINITIKLKNKKENNSTKKYLLFCDQGRIQSWEKKIAEMRKENILYNKKHNKKYNIKLKNLIEDPISRDSSKSPMLQVSDFIVTLFNKYHQSNYQGVTPKARLSFFDSDYVNELLEILKPILNIDVMKKEKYGLFIFPYNKKNTTL